MDGESRIVRMNHRAAWVVGVMAASLVLYVATLCREVYPLVSSHYLALHLGLDPWGTLSQPIWGLCQRILEWIPGGSIALRANVLSMFFSVVSVGLLTWIMMKVPHNRAGEEEMFPFRLQRVQVVTGVVAGMYLALSLPFWFAATRAHPVALQMLLLLSCAALLVRAYESKSHATRWLQGFAFLYGIALIEYPSMIALAPVAACFVLFYLWRERKLAAGILVRMGLLLVLGFLLVLPLLALFRFQDAYVWRGFHGYWHLVWMFMKEQGLVLLRGTPRVGWLLILLFTVLPWFFVVAIGKPRPKNSAQRMGSYLLHAMFTALGIMVFWNLYLAPFRQLEVQPLIVSPYVFAASTTGYLAGYWMVLLTRKVRPERPRSKALRAGLAWILPPAAAAILVAGACVNYPVISPRQVTALNRYADAVLDSLEGRNWLISNGFLDSTIAISARDRGVNLTIVDAGRAHLEVYRKYIASLYEEPRLQSMARIGLNPLLEEWNRLDPAWASKVAVLAHPELFYVVGLAPMPNRNVYLGVNRREQRAASLSRLASHQEWWGALQGALARADRPPRLAEAYLALVRNHAGKLANNLGVAIGGEGSWQEAAQAFRAARLLDSGNISALLNLYSLAELEELEDADRIAAEFERFQRRTPGKLASWSLAAVYGYLLSPRTFVERGWSWALSGMPGRAIRELEEAMAHGAEGQAIQLMLASMYFHEGRIAESEEIYREHLENNPTEQRAMFGLARIAKQQGEYDRARAFLEQMLAHGGDAGAVRTEMAALEMLAGNRDAAEALLVQVLSDEQDNERALAMLVGLAGDDEDDARREELVRRLAGLKSPSRLIRIAMATLARESGDLGAARSHLEKVLAERPDYQAGLEMMLKLDIQEGRMDLGERHVDQLLRIDPRNVFGNLVLGSIQSERQEWELAAASFRASLEGERTPEALNSLGYALLKLGDAEEALELSNEALALAPDSGAIWDTQGMALLALGRVEGAEEALRKALALLPESPEIRLHLARVLEARGRVDAAREMLATLADQGQDLPAALAEELAAMQSKLLRQSP
jgi:tetratricopeptide (TPR) repeat protein